MFPVVAGSMEDSPNVSDPIVDFSPHAWLATFKITIQVSGCVGKASDGVPFSTVGRQLEDGPAI